MVVFVHAAKTGRKAYPYLIARGSHTPTESCLLPIISSKSCTLVSQVKSPSETLGKGQPMQFEYLWLNGVPVPDLDCRSVPQRNDIHPSNPTCPSPSLHSRVSLIVEGHVCCTPLSAIDVIPQSSIPSHCSLCPSALPRSRSFTVSSSRIHTVLVLRSLLLDVSLSWFHSNAFGAHASEAIHQQTSALVTNSTMFSRGCSYRIEWDQIYGIFHQFYKRGKKEKAV